jgi:Ca-activated chloride channel family protein
MSMLAAFLTNGGSAQRLTAPDLVRATSLRLRVAIHDGVATTEIDEVLRNDGAADAEAVWLLPLPAQAIPDGFTMTVGDKELAGEVLDATRARAVYEDIVRRRRDPGLLEYFGDACLRARVFPIPPKGDVVVKVRFRHVLPQHGGMYEWRFPLRAFATSGHAPERVSIDFQLATTTALRNVLSPVAGLQVILQGDRKAHLSAEMKGTDQNTRDLQVLYSLSDAAFGLNALTYKRAGEDGYFCLLVAPKRQADAPAAPRCVQLVLDTSGSMSGRKMEQAKNAVRFFVKSLAAHDHFNVVPFATEAEPFFFAPVPATPEHIASALGKIEGLQARGGTNIEDALRRALAAPSMSSSAGTGGKAALPIVVFVTDGEPTVGQTDRERLLAAARELNAHKARLFVFGVGDTVDTKLLDRLADDNGGARDYVREDEDIEVKTSDLFAKLSHPALTDLTVHIDGVTTHSVHPQRLPDLFVGSQLMVLGRYTGSGQANVRLRGALAGSPQEFSYDAHFTAGDTSDDFVPALWAQKKIAQLLDAIRLNGQRPELLDEVRRLAQEFGIVTPFTSHLIVEESVRLGAAPRDGRLPGAASSGPNTPGPSGPATGSMPFDPSSRLAQLGAKASGERAVADSLEIKKLEGESAGAGRDDAKDRARQAQEAPTRRAGSRTFYRVGERWVDRACPADWNKRAQRVVAFSREYFDLLAKDPELKAALALGSRIVLSVGEQVLEIVPAEGG